MLKGLMGLASPETELPKHHLGWGFRNKYEMDLKRCQCMRLASRSDNSNHRLSRALLINNVSLKRILMKVYVRMHLCEGNESHYVNLPI